MEWQGFASVQSSSAVLEYPQQILEFIPYEIRVKFVSYKLYPIFHLKNKILPIQKHRLNLNQSSAETDTILECR